MAKLFAILPTNNLSQSSGEHDYRVTNSRLIKVDGLKKVPLPDPQLDGPFPNHIFKNFHDPIMTGHWQLEMLVILWLR